MEQGLITVVVPIYKVEKCLNRCLNSIVNQSYQNLEIILVDDGSPDHCPEICEEWAKKDSRIKVIHKENNGQGMARNTGIENATGEYICFVDSDDYIALDMMEKAYRLAYEKMAEIVLFGSNDVRGGGTIYKANIPNPDKLLYEGEEICGKLLPDLMASNTRTGRRINLGLSCCSALYSTRLIQRVDWRLVSERIIISEDFFSNILLYKHIRRVAILPEALYFYCENPKSFTHTYRKDRYDKIKYFYDESMKVCKELGYCAAAQNGLANIYFGFTIGALKIIAKADIPESEKKAEMQTIFKDAHLHDVLRNADIGHEKILKKAFLTAVKYRLYTLARWMILLKCINYKNEPILRKIIIALKSKIRYLHTYW